MIPLPKNLEVTFLAEKKELACTSLSEVLVPNWSRTPISAPNFPLKSSISDQIWLQMENRVFTKNLKMTWFLPIKVQISRKTS